MDSVKRDSKFLLSANLEISLLNFLNFFIIKVYFDLIFINVNINEKTKRAINQDANGL